MTQRIRRPSETCADCGSACWGRTRWGKQDEPRCHGCANKRKPTPACGTTSAYSRGCRCTECRGAVAAAAKAYRESRKARGLLAQKRRTDRVYIKGESYPDCAVCGKTVMNGRVRSENPMHKACNPVAGHIIAISRQRRLAIYARDNFTCQLCDGPVDMALPGKDRWAATLDHIIPWSLGGIDDESNLRLAHRSCNSRRGAPIPV